MWQVLTSFEIIFALVTGVVLVTQTNLVAGKTEHSLQAKAEQDALTPTIPDQYAMHLEATPMVAGEEEQLQATPTATLSPTEIPTPYLSSTPRPTPKQEPTVAPTQLLVTEPTKALEPTTQPPVQPLAASNNLLSSVNEYRKSQGKSELSSRDDLCTFTKERLNEIQNDFSHSGFQSRLSNGAFNQLNYASIAENIFAGSNEPAAVVEAWRNSSGHNQNMLGEFSWGCGQVEGSKAVFLFLR